jgi:glyoxylate reductase
VNGRSDLDTNKVYITRKLPAPALEMLKEFDITLHAGEVPPSRKEILDNVPGKDAILCMLSDKIDKEVMEAAGPQLKIISTYSTGFEHINVAEATKRGIYVTYTSDILAEATADITFALILACARNVVSGDRLVRQDKWKVGWMPDLLLGHNVHDATIGIIGLGRIGAAVARRARGFGMKILYYSPRRNQNAEAELEAQYVDLNELLTQSDFVTIHASLNGSSHYLINGERLRKMKKTAYLINTARGAIVNEHDLILALRNGTIAGAGLDVFEREPLERSSPLLDMKDNVVLLPHIGSADVMTRSKMAEVAARSIIDVLKEKRRPDQKFLVNPQVLHSC